MKRSGFLILVVLMILAAGNLYAGEASSLYSKAMAAAKRGQADIAFVHFSAILERHPDSMHVKNAIFGAGEYYYSIGDYRDALPLFERFVHEYPQARGKLFALAYLYKLSEENEREDLVKKVRKEILTFKQQSFLFRVFKNYQYRSPLSLSHRAVYYIDRVEFYIDEDLFAEIPF
jgi:outer membrane protein assembly factor BamD (BamD/ComL family)